MPDIALCGGYILGSKAGNNKIPALWLHSNSGKIENRQTHYGRSSMVSKKSRRDQRGNQELD